jgi:hypothetical protein
MGCNPEGPVNYTGSYASDNYHNRYVCANSLAALPKCFHDPRNFILPLNDLYFGKLCKFYSFRHYIEMQTARMLHVDDFSLCVLIFLVYCPSKVHKFFSFVSYYRILNLVNICLIFFCSSEFNKFSTEP